jgi:hypothetical protein
MYCTLYLFPPELSALLKSSSLPLERQRAQTRKDSRDTGKDTRGMKLSTRKRHQHECQRLLNLWTI